MSLLMIESTGRPLSLRPVLEKDDILRTIWVHCFNDEAVRDTRRNREIVQGILAAHNIRADFLQKLKKSR
jgi:hypothetical protein